MRNKKNWKRLAALALSITMLVPAQAAYAAGGQTMEPGVEAYAEGRAADKDGFRIEDGVLKSYTGTDADVVIPEGVTGIGAGVFAGNMRIKSVSIPQSVTSIGKVAFAGCWNLTEIVIPAKVASIGESAFQDCFSLEALTVQEGNTVYDSRDNCNAIMETATNTLIFGCPNTIIPEGTKHIGEMAFFRQGVKAINIPTGVESIGVCAFFGCNMTEIIFPEGLASIGKAAFAQCHELAKISLPKTVTDIGIDAFSMCYGLEEVSIPESANLSRTVTIGEYAFRMCNSLKKVNIPENVTMIGRGAFKGGVDGVTIYGKTDSFAEIYAKENNIKFSSTGAALKPIEKKTISSNHVTLSQTVYICTGEAIEPTVTVKDGDTVLKEWEDYKVSYRNNTYVGTAKVTVTGIGYYTGTVTKEFTIIKDAPEQEVKDLSQCTVTLSKPSYAYDGTAKTPTVTVKDGPAVLKEGTDYTAAYINNINVGTAKVTVTGKGNYKGTVAKNFTITVKRGTSHRVGPYQYKVTGASTVSITGVKDNKVTKIKVPKTVKIGGKAFEVTAIASRAFKNNKKITGVEIGDNVKVIGASAFEGCAKLSKATLGKGIAEIGGNAFKNCKKLGIITIKSMELKKIGRNALKGIKPTSKIKVPAKKLPAYKKLFKNKGQGRRVKIVK